MLFQLSLISHYEDVYSVKGILGLNSKKQSKNVTIQKSEANPMTQKPPNIDAYMNIHTPQIQRSHFVRVDDNILNFSFDRSSTKRFKKQDFGELKAELNQTHLKYLSKQQVVKK